ncbi:MAG: hypothetical protein NT099_04320 [Candidatus Saganbacteria bacterium]|nr:hypothetical protein [Candidatus Saganbacteria bacterium]
MIQTQRVTPKKVSIDGKLQNIGAPVPVGISPILARFWKFARQTAQQFSKNLLKAHEEDFLKVVRKEFEKDRRG